MFRLTVSPRGVSLTDEAVEWAGWTAPRQSQLWFRRSPGHQRLLPLLLKATSYPKYPHSAHWLSLRAALKRALQHQTALPKHHQSVQQLNPSSHRLQLFRRLSGQNSSGGRSIIQLLSRQTGQSVSIKGTVTTQLYYCLQMVTNF